MPAVEAICTARSELVRSLTVPRRKMSPFSELTFTCCSGSSVLSSRRSASNRSLAAAELGRTITLKNWRPPPSSQTIRLVSPGALPLTRISERLMAVASAKSPRPTAIR